jgi:hypothetical protein
VFRNLIIIIKTQINIYRYFADQLLVARLRACGLTYGNCLFIDGWVNFAVIIIPAGIWR